MKTFTKKLIKVAFLFSLFFTLFSAQAQAPQKMSYQAVIRNAANALVANTAVGVKISVLQTTATGTTVYSERHTPTTNINGLATFEIGGGVVLSGAFASINWANGPYFIKTETDPLGGTNYTIAGTSQLASVPYALFAANAGSGSNSWTVSGTNINNNNTGNVGIGNATPTEKLQVNGNAKIGENVWDSAADDRVLKFGDSNYVTIGEVGGDDKMEIKANDITLKAVTGKVLIPTGTVGIGFSNPDAILGSRLEVIKGTSATQGALTLYGTEHATEFYNFAQENVYLRGGKTGSNVLINDSAGLGNVGIGTSTPTQKLQVAGNIALGNEMYSTATGGLNMVPIGVISYDTIMSINTSPILSNIHVNEAGNLAISSLVAVDIDTDDQVTTEILLDPAICSQYTKIIAVGSAGHDNRNGVLYRDFFRIIAFGGTYRLYINQLFDSVDNNYVLIGSFIIYGIK
jgi:hypothetical protein